MKKLAILTSILALAACGGGNFGGVISPDAPIVSGTPEFDMVITDEVKESNKQITNMVSQASNEPKRTSYVKKMLGDNYYEEISGGDVNITRGATVRAATRGNSGNNICKSERDCNQIAFDNMKEWLIDNWESIDAETINNKSLRDALLLAGFNKDDLSGNWDDIKEWVENHRTEIKDIYNEYGEHQEYTLEDAKFFMNQEFAPASNMNSYISFGIDESTGQINQMKYHFFETDDPENAEEFVETVNRDGPDKNTFTETVVKYGITDEYNNTYYTDSLVPKEGGYTQDEIKAAFAQAYNDDSFSLTQIEKAFENGADVIEKEFVHKHVIDLYGKLKYSDFGYTTILAKEIHEDGDGVGDDNSVIFGGFESNEIKDTTNLKNLNFTGKAIAALGNVHQNGVQKIETGSDGATLSIDTDGTQTLTMAFNDYYTITAEKTQSGDTAISWTGETKLDYGDEHNDFALDNTATVENEIVNIKYYGEDVVPSEAVGGVSFQNNNVEFNGAFGVTTNK